MADGKLDLFAARKGCRAIEIYKEVMESEAVKTAETFATLQTPVSRRVLMRSRGVATLVDRAR